MDETEKVREILDFWFNGVDDKTFIDRKAAPFNKWFTKNADFDRQIKDRFENDVLKGGRGEYMSWTNTACGALALVILCDQFSRNIYRNTPQMFATDSLALEATCKTIRQEIDENFSLIERAFLYMPLMHAEDCTVQNMSVQCFEDLVEECKIKNPRNVSYYMYSLDYAHRHFTIIENFGRFPHRNVILGRISTPQELAFLSKLGASF